MRPEAIAEVFEAATHRPLVPGEIGAEHLPPGARVVAAMSGGVDSAVAAALLHGVGFGVIGVSMRLGASSARIEGHRGCCSLDDFDDARRVAEVLEIPHYVVDLREVFEERVITPFVQSYLHGRTPNPCALCNRDVKFDALWEYAETLGAEAIGTGHYARVERGPRALTLHAGADATKDQSYFLFTLGQRELARTTFPLGRWDKDLVRTLARQLSLPVASKPESQDICFVAGRRYVDVVEEAMAPRDRRPGEIRTLNGKVIGKHEGIHRFTIGQRRGLGGGAAAPRFVTAIDPHTGTVTVGGRRDLERRTMRVEDVRWTWRPRTGRMAVRLRHRHRPIDCRVEVVGPDARVEFDEPASGVTPGQAAVWYDGDEVLGGGWIVTG